MVFSRIQPNIKKYFQKIFLKCNQTYENIFFSGKQHFRKISIFWKCFYTNQTQPKFHVHGMQNLFVITLKENKYKAYQVNRSILFYGFSRPIEFDKFYFYGLTSVSFLAYVSNRIIMNHFLSDLTTFSLFKNYT